MIVELIRIGNSRGIRIPKPVIEECSLEHGAEMRVEDGRLIITARRPIRDGWKEAFARANPEPDDPLADMPPSDFDREEWTW